MSITGHRDPTIFKRCNLRRHSVQAEAAARRNAYLAAQRGATQTVPAIGSTKLRTICYRSRPLQPPLPVGTPLATVGAAVR